jgi:hypothetical protein
VRRSLISMLLFVLAGCAAKTQVVVIVDAQPAVRAQTQSLEVQIFGGPGGEEAVPNDPVLDRTVPTSQMDFRWPRRYVLTPRDGVVDRLYLFEAIAHRDPGGMDAPLVTARVISGYQPGQTAQIYLLLTDACIGVDCNDPNLTCDPALRRCTSSRRDEDDLTPFNPEAGVPDAGLPVDSCVTDDDCQDEVACTENRCFGGACGTAFHDESCVDAIECTTGRCLATGCVPVANDDACLDLHDCTTDTCDVESGCLHTPDDTTCDQEPGGTCDSLNGCQYPTCTTANCVPSSDPCEMSAACSGNTCVRTALCAGCCAGDCETDDSNECTVGACTASGWEHTPTPFASCNDENECTQLDNCSSGTCAGSPVACYDANDCTDDSPCDPLTGCTFPPYRNGQSCTDVSTGCAGICNGGTCFPSCPRPDGGMTQLDSGIRWDAGRDAGGGYDSGYRPDASGGCTFDWQCPDDSGGDPCTSGRCYSGTCGFYTDPSCQNCGGAPCDAGACCGSVCCNGGEQCCGDHCCPQGTACAPGTCIVDPCDPNPCDGGTCCPDGTGGYQCSGTGLCGQTDQCNPNPCDGGLCCPEPTGGFTCSFTGFCETTLDPCVPDPCAGTELPFCCPGSGLCSNTPC